MQRDPVGNRPEEGETDHPRFTRDGVRAARAGEEGVGVEEDVVPVQQQRAGEVAAGEDGGYAGEFLG